MKRRYGACNKITGIFYEPDFANEKEEYVCCDCEREVVLINNKKIGKKYFRHKFRDIKRCTYYNNPKQYQKELEVLYKIKYMKYNLDCKE